MRKNIISLLLILILCTSCTKKEPDLVSLSFLSEINVHEEIMYHDLVTDSNVDIISDNFKIIPNKIGVNNYELDYKYNNKKYTRNFSVEVVDKTPPFIYSGSSRTIYLNNNHDFCEEFILGDNYDSYPKCEIIGNYDNQNIGNYNVTMKVTDQSDNITTKDLTIKVIEYVKKDPSDKPAQNNGLEFSEVIERHKGDNTSFGIDVSSWQGDVDYEEVKNAGASFVMIRLGYQGSKTGLLTLDNYFKQNLENAKKAGLKVGVYLYTDVNSIEEARNHAKWVLEELGNTPLELPIVFDWEDFGKFRQRRISLYELNEMANVFIRTVKESGYEGMLYGSRTYLEQFWENKHNYPVWLAHYTKETSYEGDYLMWQLSQEGRIPGIEGAVDINVMYEVNNE